MSPERGTSYFTNKNLDIPMRITVMYLGKTSSTTIQGLCEEYVRRCSRYCKIELKALVLKQRQKDHEVLKREEGRLIIDSLSNDDQLIVLDEKGSQKDSRQLAEDIRKHFVHSSKRLVFLIGGAYGFSDEVYARANEQLALSAMTMNHEMALLVLTEQLYRSMSIIHNHPYHND